MFARAVLLLAAALVPVVDVVFAVPQERKPRKVAFLVGVGAFQFDPPELNGSPQKDVAALAEVLRAGGFEVVVLTDKDATKAGVEKRFRAVLAGDGDAAKAIGKRDLLLVGICTHGFTLPPADGKPDAPFLAAHDSKLGKPDTMIPLNGLLDEAKSSGATALYLIDACRETPADANRGQTRGVEGANVTLPPRTAILFSCRRGQVSHQNEKANGHGLFTFAVLSALQADGQPKDDVSWTDLVAGVQKSFRSEKFRAMIPAGKPQVPVLAVGGEFDDAHLMTVKQGDDPPAGKEIDVEIADGVKMRFCWIPKGKATLGSPKDEKYRYDHEGDREFETKGFWLGKFEVTQDEWRAVMSNNPSYYDGTKNNKAKGEKTGRLPVECVSWDDIQPLLKKLNDRGGAAKVFGKAGRFVLPHEDEWEYAARGGHTDRRPFYWGSSLDGSQANVDGTSPYGTPAKGAFLERPTPVGSYEAKHRHPWGLCDMHGNVVEWCENKDERYSDFRRTRGGSWHDGAMSCRAAQRRYATQAEATSDRGFRVLFRLD